MSCTYEWKDISMKDKPYELRKEIQWKINIIKISIILSYFAKIIKTNKFTICGCRWDDRLYNISSNFVRLQPKTVI